MGIKVKDVLNRVMGENPKTSYAVGILAYAEEMLKYVEGGAEAEVPTQFAPCQAMFLMGNEDWKSMSLNCWWMPDKEAMAWRLGIANIVDMERSDVHQIQGDALRSAFLLIWAEVSALAKMEETFLIRRVRG